MEAITAAHLSAAAGQNTGERLGNLIKKLPQARDHSEEIRLLLAIALREREPAQEEGA